ncbi:MAG: trypsin-like peptidase domain-containing protein, partial [Planctomycetes bacterium]|nr:trypsin-like peptidase domain-containing protein [Planctomycetota bacterium]
MGSFLLRITLLLLCAMPPLARAQDASEETSGGKTVSQEVQENTLRDQIRISTDRVGILEVVGATGSSTICKASAFLIAPDRAVSSAQALAGGFGARIRVGDERREAKVVGLDLLHDVAILQVDPAFPVEHGIYLQGTELVGNERVAILGTTSAMEPVAGLGTLTGLAHPKPLGTFASAKNLGQPGLRGAPVLNGQGRVLGMITS